MILRVAKGRVPTKDLGSLAQAFSASVPDARVRPGLVRFHVGVRPDGQANDVVAVTVWESVEAALEAFAGDLSPNRTLGEIGRVAEFSGADHYEVDESQLRQSAAGVSTLRLTTGQVDEGRAAVIHEELRRRFPVIGEEMTEAYIGRRLVGTAVEVAFLSAWSRAPVGRSLAEPLWPDISASYDRFWVRTYMPISAGLAIREPVRGTEAERGRDSRPA